MTVNEQNTGTLDAIGERDHGLTSEYRLYGPPGTGKTTTVARQIRRAAEKYGPAALLVTSFSRAAAAELAGRDLPIERKQVGTLHSHCYRALGEPEIAEARLDEWNKSNPHLALTPVRKQGRIDGEDIVDDESELVKDGDRALQELSRLRGRMVPRDSWPATIRQFALKWENYKRANGLMDFTDLIETCMEDMAVAPGNPSVIFADEAQDLNKMQLSLIRRWGEHAQYFIVAGDDDQTIYTFAGATPEAILHPEIPADHKIILKQSYRVPRTVHRAANKLIAQVGRRQAKEYLPRNEEGVVQRLSSGSYKCPEYGILKTATEHLSQRKTVMLLASCSYMLKPIIAVLRKEGIPFHNLYRKSNGFWNPLRLSNQGSAANRIVSLLSAHPSFGKDDRPWTHGDLASWTEWLVGNGLFRPDGRELLNRTAEFLPVDYKHLIAIFEPAAIESLLTAYEVNARALLDWWRARLMTQFWSRCQFPLAVAKARGSRALTEPPKIVVGTIHSVKGGEADVVYIFPDLSRSGDTSYNRGGADRDAVIRLFYVGVTRARECLYICQRETAMSIAL